MGSDGRVVADAAADVQEAVPWRQVKDIEAAREEGRLSVV
jgi:hypothetical protein